jgi:hypothetical protein
MDDAHFVQPNGTAGSATMRVMSGDPEPQLLSPVGIPSGGGVGVPHLSLSASREWLVEGYVRALARFRTASEQVDKSTRDTFLPLFETLNWAVAVQDYLREGGEPLDAHEIVRALRFARNRVHHAWAAALEPREHQVTAGAGPIAIVGTTFDWFWIAAARLPVGGNRNGEEEYNTLLADHLARSALDGLERLLRAT